LVATIGSGPPTNTTVTLQASQRYYVKLVASIQGGLLSASANAKMFDSKLSGKVSSMVKNEVQEIEITSTTIPEKTVKIK
jgi:hypothetical protein